jgi:hypothetical protein
MSGDWSHNHFNNRADRLRREAERVRALALRMRSRNAFCFLMDTASEYELMAQLCEKMRRMAKRLPQRLLVDAEPGPESMPDRR